MRWSLKLQCAGAPPGHQMLLYFNLKGQLSKVVIVQNQMTEKLRLIYFLIKTLTLTFFHPFGRVQQQPWVRDRERKGRGVDWECGEKRRVKCSAWLAHILLENKTGAVTTPTFMFLRQAERDGDETTDDSHFTVRGCKRSTHSRLEKHGAIAPSWLALTHISSVVSLSQLHLVMTAWIRSVPLFREPFASRWCNDTTSFNTHGVFCLICIN